MAKKQTRRSISVSAAMYEALVAIAKERDEAISRVVTEALQDHFANMPPTHHVENKMERAHRLSVEAALVKDRAPPVLRCRSWASGAGCCVLGHGHAGSHRFANGTVPTRANAEPLPAPPVDVYDQPTRPRECGWCGEDFSRGRTAPGREIKSRAGVDLHGRQIYAAHATCWNEIDRELRRRAREDAAIALHLDKRVT